jgi:hypothetical protein
MDLRAGLRPRLRLRAGHRRRREGEVRPQPAARAAGIAFVAWWCVGSQVLEAVGELREASLQLVGEVRLTFERAIAEGLLARRRVDQAHNEVMYALIDAGRRILADGE